MKQVQKILDEIYFRITSENINWSIINKKKYYKELEKILFSNKIFYDLSKKYKYEDIFLNKKLILEKYIYVYIFFEILYERIKDSTELKNKVFNIDYKKSSFGFVNLKRDTLKFLNYLGKNQSKLIGNNKAIIAFNNNFGIGINILEAVIKDLIEFQFTNSFIGILLILMLPFHGLVINEKETKISKKWINLYTSWNYHFIYNKGPGITCFPLVGICLLNSVKHNKKNLWINNRFYTLFLSMVLEPYEEFKLEKNINKDFLKDWNKLNLAYAFA